MSLSVKKATISSFAGFQRWLNWTTHKTTWYILILRTCFLNWNLYELFNSSPFCTQFCKWENLSHPSDNILHKAHFPSPMQSLHTTKPFLFFSESLFSFQHNNFSSSATVIGYFHKNKSENLPMTIMRQGFWGVKDWVSWGYDVHKKGIQSYVRNIMFIHDSYLQLL